MRTNHVRMLMVIEMLHCPVGPLEVTLKLLPIST